MIDENEYWLATVYSKGRFIQTMFDCTLIKYAEEYGDKEPIIFAYRITQAEYHSFEV